MSDICPDVCWVANHKFFTIDDDCITRNRFTKLYCGCKMVGVIYESYVKSTNFSHKVRK